MIIPAKLWLIGGVVVVLALTHGGAYLVGLKSSAGVIATDTAETLVEDRERADELSGTTSRRIRGLEATIARLKRDRSNLDDCIIPEVDRVSRSAAIREALGN